MRAAEVYSRWLFLIAAIYGILILTPLLFLEDFMGRVHPPAITHAEFFYGFVGAALAFQFVFLVIATDPLRYRPLIVAAIVEKASYAVAVLVLVNQGRMSGGPVVGGVIDLVLGVLFVVSYVMLSREARRVT